MCAGDGGTNFVQCTSVCDVSLNEPAIAASAWYGYCVIFFKEMCPDARATSMSRCSKNNARLRRLPPLARARALTTAVLGPALALVLVLDLDRALVLDLALVLVLALVRDPALTTGRALVRDPAPTTGRALEVVPVAHSALGKSPRMDRRARSWVSNL